VGGGLPLLAEAAGLGEGLTAERVSNLDKRCLTAGQSSRVKNSEKFPQKFLASSMLFHF
jgi:hypothetical protein